MARYVLFHIVKCAVLLLAVSFLCFALVNASPIDPVQANLGQAAYINMSPEKRADLAAYWGVDAPLWESYANWLGGAMQGDWGTSLRYNAPVLQVIAERTVNTLMLMAIAWVVSGLLGFVLGIAAALHRGGWLDRIIKGYCYLLAATPTFWLAMIFLLCFSVLIPLFPIGFSLPIGVASSEATLLDALHHLALPAITLSLVGVANIALHTREKTIDVLESDYVRFARMRGMRPAEALRNGCWRNLLLPALTLQFASISEIFGGSVLVEEVFSYPGLGQAAVTAALGGDVALLAGIAVISAVLVFGGNLAANILYGVIDPRIRRGEGLHDESGRGDIAGIGGIRPSRRLGGRQFADRGEVIGRG